MHEELWINMNKDEQSWTNMNKNPENRSRARSWHTSFKAFCSGLDWLDWRLDWLVGQWGRAVVERAWARQMAVGKTSPTRMYSSTTTHHSHLKQFSRLESAFDMISFLCVLRLLRLDNLPLIQSLPTQLCPAHFLELHVNKRLQFKKIRVALKECCLQKPWLRLGQSESQQVIEIKQTKTIQTRTWSDNKRNKHMWRGLSRKTSLFTQRTLLERVGWTCWTKSLLRIPSPWRSDVFKCCKNAWLQNSLWMPMDPMDPNYGRTASCWLLDAFGIWWPSILPVKPPQSNIMGVYEGSD